ncbi:hypothetical protein TREMEDRAFT_32435, partial [Tremella mesenterica DSM 1558]|uniref:uncharacterized protein n=1 Tax=Tremella mesenterica (strain ATCC 24925 / CBS 8224 / DSM 1558 / NBRC 9311 / NRRL Y-6157 / RJB 2259-6 / UBC 559-6) TaxID=578456 RepID=UPI0003F49D5B
IWWLFPPSSLLFLKGKNGEIPFDIREKDLDLEVQALGTIKILQQVGDILFVPSGWYHQVVNVDFCISINHNFLSSPTLLNVFRALENAQSDVEDSLEDVKRMIISRHSGYVEEWEKEWIQQVQDILRLDAGWNWSDFWDCVLRNISDSMDEYEPPKEMRDEWVREVISLYRTKREWKVLDDVREMIRRVGGVVGYE